MCESHVDRYFTLNYFTGVWNVLLLKNKKLLALGNFYIVNYNWIEMIYSRQMCLRNWFAIIESCHRINSFLFFLFFFGNLWSFGMSCRWKNNFGLNYRVVYVIIVIDNCVISNSYISYKTLLIIRYTNYSLSSISEIKNVPYSYTDIRKPRKVDIIITHSDTDVCLYQQRCENKFMTEKSVRLCLSQNHTSLIRRKRYHNLSASLTLFVFLFYLIMYILHINFTFIFYIYTWIEWSNFFIFSFLYVIIR